MYASYKAALKGLSSVIDFGLGFIVFYATMLSNYGF